MKMTRLSCCQHFIVTVCLIILCASKNNSYYRYEKNPKQIYTHLPKYGVPWQYASSVSSKMPYAASNQDVSKRYLLLEGSASSATQEHLDLSDSIWHDLDDLQANSFVQGDFDAKVNNLVDDWIYDDYNEISEQPVVSHNQIGDLASSHWLYDSQPEVAADRNDIEPRRDLAAKRNDVVMDLWSEVTDNDFKKNALQQYQISKEAMSANDIQERMYTIGDMKDNKIYVKHKSRVNVQTRNKKTNTRKIIDNVKQKAKRIGNSIIMNAKQWFQKSPQLPGAVDQTERQGLALVGSFFSGLASAAPYTSLFTAMIIAIVEVASMAVQAGLQINQSTPQKVAQVIISTTAAPCRLYIIMQ